jgi:hypothetical protein
MAVVSVKAPEWVKEKMKEFSDVINWPEEIRNFIIAKINEIERVRAVERAIKILEKVPPAEQGTAKKLIREDRDSH